MDAKLYCLEQKRLNNQKRMGSHHHQVAILVPDDKVDCFGQFENFLLDQKWSSFLPGTSVAT